MKKILAIFLATLFLSACQSTYVRHSLPMDSIFHLNHEIRFHPSQVAIYLQHGQIVPANSIDDYSPNCTLEVKHKLAHSQTFHPDQFRIDKVRYEIAANNLSTPLVTHSLAFGGQTRYPEYITDIYLHSADQPNIYKLTCQHLEEPENARHLTLEEIQGVLGEIMTITFRH